MADWKAIYERAEDRHLEMLNRLVAELQAEREAQKDFSQDTTGTTTMSKEEKPHD